MAAIIIETTKIPSDLIEYFVPLENTKGDVWTIPTQSFSDAHFATFPEKLVEPMILSGCPEFVCKKCGMGRRKVYSEASGGAIGKAWLDHSKDNEQGNLKTVSSEGYQKGQFKGYTDCGCNAGWRPGIVLDLFCRQWNHRQGSCAIAA